MSSTSLFCVLESILTFAAHVVHSVRHPSTNALCPAKLSVPLPSPLPAFAGTATPSSLLPAHFPNSTALTTTLSRVTAYSGSSPPGQVQATIWRRGDVEGGAEVSDRLRWVRLLERAFTKVNKSGAYRDFASVNGLMPRNRGLKHQALGTPPDKHEMRTETDKCEGLAGLLLCHPPQQ